MDYVVKAAIGDPKAKIFTFTAQKTMYGGKHIAVGDVVFIFASETQGGQGLIARGLVTAAAAVPKKRGVERQTPRVSITVNRTALAKKGLGRDDLRPCNKWNDGRPETELNFKFFRQSTNKICGISEEAALFLGRFF